DEVHRGHAAAGDEVAVGAVRVGSPACASGKPEIAAGAGVAEAFFLLLLQTHGLVQPAPLAGGGQELDQAPDELRIVAEAGRLRALAGEVEQHATLVDAVEGPRAGSGGGLAVA